ncbi:AraC family transcriptional regulator [Nocardia sp. NPDC006630]|uniref:AraC family transcriptional regulator n=1 Tax=Nocardia sp. NPDC006630 TaxID=3157181 RepID=UPI0033B12CF3
MPTASNIRPARLDYWEARVSTDIVPSTMEPIAGRSFRGSFASVVSGVDVSIAVGHGGPVLSRRTARHIADTDNRYLVAVMPSSGSALVITEDRHETPLLPGSLVLIDTDKPSAVRIDDYSAQVVVRVPWALLLTRSELDENTFGRLFARPLTLPAVGVSALVGNYFRGVAALDPELSADLPALTVHAVDLLASLIAVVSGRRPPDGSALAHARERVMDYVRHHFTDAALTAEAIAAGCSMSRSTLYRATQPDGGVATLLRRLRVAHAQRLLLAQPHTTIGVIAKSCGFSSDRHLFRAFRNETGLTPGAYRAGQHRSPASAGLATDIR